MPLRLGLLRPLFALSLFTTSAILDRCPKERSVHTVKEVGGFLPLLERLKLHSQARSSASLRCDSLKTLDVSDTELRTLPALPKTLRALSARNLGLADPSKLPANLSYLDIRGTVLPFKLGLPRQLTSILIDAQALPYLDFPQALRFLSVDFADLQTFSAPDGLEILVLNNPTGSRWLKTLPPHLLSLSLSNDSLGALPTLPPSLLSLEICRSNDAQHLRFVAPRSVQRLRLDGAAPTNWPELARNLSELDINNRTIPNDLRSNLQKLKLTGAGAPLPPLSLPSSLTELSLLSFSGGDLPALPTHLAALDLTGTQLADLSPIRKLRYLKRLVLANQSTVDLHIIPDSLERLDISGVEHIISIPDWPANLETLIYKRGSQDFLSSLPQTLDELNIDETHGIAKLPPKLRVERFSARDSDLEHISVAFLHEVQSLDICGSRVEKLPNMALPIKALSVHLDQIGELSLQRELRVLIVRMPDECIDSDIHRWLNVEQNAEHY